MASSVKVPLLNSYKRQFVYKRLPETFFGGLKLRFGHQVPCYVYLLQLGVWIFPLIIGGTLSLVSELTNFWVLYAAIIAGIVVFAFVLLTQLYHLVRDRRYATVSPLNASDSNSREKLKQHRALNEDEEDIVDFTSCFSYVTYKFIFPPKRSTWNMVVDALVCGVMSGVSVWYHSPTLINSLYGRNSPGLTAIITIFSWFSFLIGQHALVVGAVRPIETSAYQMDDKYGIGALSRMLHMALIFVLQIVQIYVPGFDILNRILHIVFLFLPFFWFFALLPTLEPLFFWLLEQLLIFAMGGSPMATNIRIVLGFLIGAAVLIPACFLSSTLILVIYTSVFGLVLSLDVIGTLDLLAAYLHSKLTSTPNSSVRYGVKEAAAAERKPQVKWGEAAFILLMLLLNALVASLCAVYASTIKAGDSVKLALEIVMLVLLALTYILQDSQRVYYLLAIFKNPLHRNKTLTDKRYVARPLDGFGVFHFAVVYLISPLVMTSFCAVFLIDVETGTDVLPAFSTAIYATHAFRMIWQRSKDGLLVIAVYSLMDLIISSQSSSWLARSPIGLVLIVIDVACDRVVKFASNMWLVVQMTVTNYTNEKLRRKSSLFLLIFNLVISPMLIVLACGAALLSSSLLPLFTLPIFFIAFPRPNKFWPHDSDARSEKAGGGSSEQATYAEMKKPIAEALVRGVRYGSYVPTISPGTNLQFYLLRSQDRSLFVQTLESGYSYVTMSIKGLELQETSCHSVEITKVDDMCAVAFDKTDSRTAPVILNQHWLLSTLTLLDRFNIEAYSDSTTSLAGIVDSREALDRFVPDLIAANVWLLLHRQATWLPLVKRDEERKSLRDDDVKPVMTSPRRPHSPPGVALDADDDFWGSDDDEDGGGGATGGGDPYGGLPLVEENVAAKSNAPPHEALEDPLVREKKRTDIEKSAIGGGSGGVSGEGERRLAEVIDEARALADAKLVERVEQVMSRDWVKLLSRDEPDLVERVRQITIMNVVMFHQRVVPGNDLTKISSKHLCRSYLDENVLPGSMEVVKRDYPQLYHLAVQANRYAMKLMYDRVVMGGDEDDDEVINNLNEYHETSHVGVMSSREWCRSITRATPNLFAIYYDQQAREYKVRALWRHQSVETSVSQVSWSGVRAMWANLAFELLYATNDDDERLSIQAHPSLLRNITIQSAHQPLGYPLFHSSPITISTLAKN